MSTDYRLNEEVKFEELFDGRLERVGIRDACAKDTTPTSRCLTDGNNYLWVYGDEVVEVMSRYGLGNVPGKILSAIAEIFDTDIFSEHQPQYWGYETEEEWKSALQESYEEDQAELYIEIMKYIRGESHDITPGTVGMAWANIAKDLIAEDPSLASPDHEAELMEKMNSIYRKDHIVKINLTEQDITSVKMLMTHEDDFPWC
jgi:hypothetical protein